MKSASSALSADQAYFLEELYDQYQKQPQTVAPEWRDLFQGPRVGRPHQRTMS
jgi:2-oxoglutarate dehydrogenase E1 component